MADIKYLAFWIHVCLVEKLEVFIDRVAIDATRSTKCIQCVLVGILIQLLTIIIILV